MPSAQQEFIDIKYHVISFKSSPVLTSQNRLALLQALRERCTCRAFLPRAVSVELLERLLETANRAPSGGNTQPWHLYVACLKPVYACW